MPIAFEPEKLGKALKADCPEIRFALLMGSARDGIVPPGGDVDLAVDIEGKLSLALVERVTEIVRQTVGDVDVDIGCFNGAEPVYRFEAIKGRLLFARDMDRFAHAFSLACREYESQMKDYERQMRYRLQRKRDEIDRANQE